MPLYDFKCNKCEIIQSLHLSAANYDEAKKNLACVDCGNKDLERNFRNQKMQFSGVFHEEEIGGIKFSTQREKKEYMKRNDLQQLSADENRQNALHVQKRVDKEIKEETHRDVEKLVKQTIARSNK